MRSAMFSQAETALAPGRLLIQPTEHFENNRLALRRDARSGVDDFKLDLLLNLQVAVPASAEDVHGFAGFLGHENELELARFAGDRHREASVDDEHRFRADRVFPEAFLRIAAVLQHVRAREASGRTIGIQVARAAGNVVFLRVGLGEERE